MSEKSDRREARLLQIVDPIITKAAAPLLNTPIGRFYHKLKGRMVDGIAEGYLWMDTPDILYALVGAVAGGILPGPNFWLMLVCPASSGKSEFLKAFRRLDNTKLVSTTTGEAAYLSATPDEHKEKGATGGLLREIGAHGMIIHDDQARILNMQPQRREEFASLDRDIFSRDFNRSSGGGGGKPFEWRGKIVKLAGITTSIDNHHEISAELGQRWSFFRMAPSKDWEAENDWISARDESIDWQSEVTILVKGFFDSFGLKFGGGLTQCYREVTPEDRKAIMHIARITAHGRAGVSRDYKTDDIISHRTDIEQTKRLTGGYTQLLKGMSQCGVPDQDCWRVIRSVALGSMPLVRLNAIMRAWEKGTVDTGDLQEMSGMGGSTVRRVLDDLIHTDILKRITVGKIEIQCVLTDWVRVDLDTYFKDKK